MTDIMTRLSKVAKKTWNKKHVAGLVVLLLTFSMFFSVIAVLQPGGPFGHAKASTVSGRIYAEAAVGWYQGYATWSTGTAYIYTSQAPNPPSTYNDQFDMRFDIAGTIGSGATISDITLYVSKGGQGTINSGALSVDALNPFTWTWGGTATWQTYGIASISTSGTNMAYRSITGITSYAQADYASDGHFYVGITKGTADLANAYANLGMNATDNYPTNGPPYVIVTYTGAPATWAPTITSTPPVGTHAIYADNYGASNMSPTADNYLEVNNQYDANGLQTFMVATVNAGSTYDVPIFRWNVTGIPADATIIGAYLWLYKYSIQDDAMLYRVYKDNPYDWTEDDYSYYWYNNLQGKTATYTDISTAHGNGWVNLTSATLTTIANSQFQSYGKVYLSIWQSTGTAQNYIYSKEYTGTANDPYLYLTWTNSTLDRYVFVTGDSYSYHITVNETSTITVPSKPTWTTYTSGNATIWGTCSAGNVSINISAVSTPGTLTAWQNFTPEVWGVAPPGPPTWEPHVTSIPVTSIYFGIAYSYHITWNESVNSIAVSTNASWLTYTDINSTLWGRAPNASESVYVNIYATSDAGGLENFTTYTIYVTPPIPPTSTQKYLAWLSGSGIMFLIGAIGLVGMIGTPWFYFKYGSGDTGWRIVMAIGSWFFFFGLFYGSVVVFG